MTALRYGLRNSMTTWIQLELHGLCKNVFIFTNSDLSVNQKILRNEVYSSVFRGNIQGMYCLLPFSALYNMYKEGNILSIFWLYLSEQSMRRISIRLTTRIRLMILWLRCHSLQVKGRPLMIWGRAGGNREKKISEALLQEKIFLEGPSPGKIFSWKVFREKKFHFENFL